MSSPDITRTHQSEPVDWRPLNQLDAQEAQAYPAGYEQARRRLVCHLLSTTATTLPEEDQRETSLAATRDSVVHDVYSERAHVLAKDCADGAEPIQGKSKRGRQRREEFHYVSSFDRLTLNEPSVHTQRAPRLLGRRVLKALAVAAALAVGALIYASGGSVSPRLLEGVRTFLHDRAER
jgi:hypothetical protein